MKSVCSLPVPNTDGTANGSRRLLPARLDFRKADNIKLVALASDTACDFRVLLQIYESHLPPHTSHAILQFSVMCKIRTKSNRPPFPHLAPS